MAMTPPFTAGPAAASPRSVSGNRGKLTAAQAMSSTRIRAPGTVPSTANAMASRWSPAVRTGPRGGALAALDVQIVTRHLGPARLPSAGSPRSGRAGRSP